MTNLESMTLEHYTAEPLVLDRTRVYEQRVHFKPRGFWVSVKGEDDWPTWCREENFAWSRLEVCQEVKVSETANILALGSVPEIVAFHAMYHAPLMPDSRSRFSEYIDWERVTKDYDGIIIAPYQWSIRMRDDLFWYYTWDVASGCIWNLNAIESVTVTVTA
jgi:hypothetical protein